MHTSKTLLGALGAVAALTSASCRTDRPAVAEPTQQATTPVSAPATIEMSVTTDGFVPAEVRVKVGQPVRLVVTRRVDRTCATDIVIKQFGISQPLPLNEPVAVTFTPNRAGNIRYACAMDMIAGVIIVE